VVRVRTLAEAQKRHSLRITAMMHFGVEVSLGFDETVYLLLEQVQTLRSVVQTAQR